MNSVYYYIKIKLDLELFRIRDEQMVSGIGTGLKFTKPVYFWYRFCTVIHRFLPNSVFSVTVFSVPVDTELIKSCSNASMQVLAPFRLLFIHTVSKLYFV
ncbi:hypothetical protein HanHA300_Chr05g0181121 [Helianthus annuus]|nr:hypothetical protein HanHA300_Chr05g0181121 [Helianthus annuus]KAJ0585042.1 hypothetical protein HanHA89_Chr05g0195811 [Helianthus annuus]